MIKKVHSLITLGLCAFLICACGKGTPKEPEKPVENNQQNEERDEETCRHVLTLKDQKNPTFYEDGYEGHFECTKCAKIFNTDGEEITPESIRLRLPLFDTLDQEDPITLFGKELNLEYNASDYEQLVMDSNALIQRINRKSYYSATEANNMIERINDMLSFVYKQYDISYLLADAYATANDYNKKNEIYKAYYGLQDQYFALYVAIAKEGSYNNLFFKNKTQEYIDQYIADHSPKEGSGGSTTITTSQKIEMLLNDYKAGKLERYQAFHDYVALAKQLAEEKKADNYLAYKYKQNGRDYTVEKAMDLSGYVTTYLTPLRTSLREKLSILEQDQEIKKSRTALEKNFFGKNIDLLREYSLTLGSPYKENFQSFFEGGNYFFSNVDNPNVTGYTATNASFGRIIFLSKGYQNLMTFTHEFGHYNAGEVFGGTSSLDLLETHSQGNAMLLLSYIKNSSLIEPKVAQAFTYEELAAHINDVLIGCAVNELENYAYTTDFDQTSLENKFEELIEKYGANITRNHKDFMYQVLLNYQGYYISYAVSAVAAIELYAKATDNFTSGVNAYKSIFTKDTPDEEFTLSLSNAGLIDIFDENAYKTIQSALGV